MDQIIIATSEKREINYSEILGFFSFKKYGVEEAVDAKEGQALIIDTLSKERAIELANDYRKKYKSLPILILTDYYQIFTPDDISRIEGRGQIRIHSVTADNGDKIVELLNALLNPEYASEVFKLSIIVPLYNEGERFEHVLNFAEKLNLFLEESYRNSKIYFINDGSVDNTGVLTEKLVKRLSESSSYISDFGFLEVRELEKNTRKAGTYIEGIKNVHSNIIVIVDGDDSFYVEDIAKIVNILREGYYDIVAGTKDLTAENRPLSRKILSFIKRTLTKPLLPKGIYDAQTGLKGMRGDTARYILPHLSIERELAIDLEMLYICKKLRFRAMQLPVRCVDREGSHVDIVRDSLKYLKSIMNILCKQSQTLEVRE